MEKDKIGTETSCILPEIHYNKLLEKYNNFFNDLDKNTITTEKLEKPKISELILNKYYLDICSIIITNNVNEPIEFILFINKEIVCNDIIQIESSFNVLEHINIDKISNKIVKIILKSNNEEISHCIYKLTDIIVSYIPTNEFIKSYSFDNDNDSYIPTKEYLKLHYYDFDCNYNNEPIIKNFKQHKYHSFILNKRYFDIVGINISNNANESIDVRLEIGGQNICIDTILSNSTIDILKQHKIPFMPYLEYHDILITFITKNKKIKCTFDKLTDVVISYIPSNCSDSKWIELPIYNNDNDINIICFMSGMGGLRYN